MYVFIANGYKGIIESKHTLDFMAAIYPYPKFRKVKTYEDALRFLARYDRGVVQPNFNTYGDTDNFYGYATIKYIIDKEDLFVTIDTSKIGFIRIDTRRFKDTVVDNRPSMIRLRVRDIHLNDMLISDHCIAVTTILELLGDYVDVNIEVPDISVYLALTKYSGENYVIRQSQEIIGNRLGGVSLTIK